MVYTFDSLKRIVVTLNIKAIETVFTLIHNGFILDIDSKRLIFRYSYHLSDDSGYTEKDTISIAFKSGEDTCITIKLSKTYNSIISVLLNYENKVVALENKELYEKMKKDKNIYDITNSLFKEVLDNGE